MRNTTSSISEFFPGAFDPAFPRKGGGFEVIQEKKWDNTPEDELRHDVTDELAAYKLAQLPFPGVFGVFYQSDRPTKNAVGAGPSRSDNTMTRAVQLACPESVEWNWPHRLVSRLPIALA